MANATIKATLAAIKTLPNMTASYDSDDCEWRVAFTTEAIREVHLKAGLSTNFAFVQKRAEAVACYTQDKMDALDTALAMSKAGYKA